MDFVLLALAVCLGASASATDASSINRGLKNPASELKCSIAVSVNGNTATITKVISGLNSKVTIKTIHLNFRFHHLFQVTLWPSHDEYITHEFYSNYHVKGAIVCTLHGKSFNLTEFSTG